ncbi:MAG: DUF2142 domain-containing protein [Armatimonadetes bacterium]|nr:DUF2142 domain-containing protein [Armatimonadota bacterium]
MKKKAPKPIQPGPLRQTAPAGTRALAASRHRFWMGVLIAVYVLLSLLYNGAMPFGKPPDEGAHLLYTKHLADKWEFPVLDENVREEFESHQPPLHYILALPFYLSVRGWAGEETTGFVVRLLSTLIGIALLIVAHRAMRLLYGDGLLSLFVPALIAFLPMHLAVTSSFNNDALTELWFFLIFYLTVLSLKNGLTPRRSLAAGLVIGAGLLTKSSAISLFPIWLLVVYLSFRSRPGMWRDIARHTAIAFGTALLVGGWWLARNALIYGDPLGAAKFVEFFHRPDRRDNPEWWLAHGFSWPMYLGLVCLWTFQSWLGVFNHMDLFMSPWIYALFGLVACISIYGLVRYWEGPGRQLQGYQKESQLVFAVGWLLVHALFFKFMLTFFQAQGRYLFPVLLPSALWLVIGFREAFPSRKGEIAAFSLVGGMALLSLIALLIYLMPGG